MERISLKISDFGLARGFNPDVQTMTLVGTLCFMAPEVLKANSKGEVHYSSPADVYALGVVVKYLYTKDLQRAGEGCLMKQFTKPIPWFSLVLEKNLHDYFFVLLIF